MAEPEDEKKNRYNEAGEDHQESVLDSGYVAAGVGFSISLCGLVGIGLLSFHNVITKSFLSLLVYFVLVLMICFDSVV